MYSNWQGHHNYNIPLASNSYRSTANKWDLIHQILYNPILVLVRASIIYFLLTLEQARRTIRRHLYAIRVVNVAWLFAIFFTVLFQCRPFHYTFDARQMDQAAREAAGTDVINGVPVKGGWCINRPVFFLTSGIIGVVIDMWLLCIPSALVWGLNMPIRQKAVVVVVLSFWVTLVRSLPVISPAANSIFSGHGLVSPFGMLRLIEILSPRATIVGVIRLGVLTPDWLRPSGLDELRDTNYDVVWTFSLMQCNVSIWTASAPAFKVMINWLWPMFWPETSKETSDGSQRSYQGPYYRPPLGGGSYGQRRGSGSSRIIPFLEPRRRGMTQSELDLRRFEHDTRITTLGSRQHASDSDIPPSSPDQRRDIVGPNMV
jgi:hypothetical protein